VKLFTAQRKPNPIHQTTIHSTTAELSCGESVVDVRQFNEGV